MATSVASELLKIAYASAVIIPLSEGFSVAFKRESSARYRVIDQLAKQVFTKSAVSTCIFFTSIGPYIISEDAVIVAGLTAVGLVAINGLGRLTWSLRSIFIEDLNPISHV